MIKHPTKPRFNLYFLSLILILAVFVRLRGVVMGYFAFTFDQGRDLLAIRDLVVNHKLSLIGPFSGLSGVFYGPWWYWILSIPFIFGGGDPRFIAGFIALANILVPAGLYFFGRKAGSEFAGLVGATVAAFSPLLIGYSAQIWNPNIVPPLTMLAILLWRRLMGGQSVLSWFVFGLTLGLIVNFQISFGLALLLGIVPWIIFMVITRRASWRQLGLWSTGLLIPFIPLILFDTRHNFLEVKSILTYLQHRPIRSHDYDAFPLMSKFQDRGNLFWSILVETLGSGRLATIATLLFAASSFLVVRKKQYPHFSVWLLICISVVFAFFMWYPDTVWNYYLVGLPVIYLILMTVMLALLFQRIQASWRLLVQRIVLLSFFLVLFPFKDIPEWLGWQKSWEGDGSVFRNQLAILDYIYHDVGEKPLNIMVYTPPIYDFHYQYLFWWYGGKKYGRMPGGERAGNLYLIMEPNKDAPWLWEGWIKTVVLDPGKVVSHKEFPGGVVVEKRVL